MTITAARTAPPAPSIEALELAIEAASLSDIMLCASAGLDAIVVDWGRFASVHAAVETDTYRVDGRVASMVCGLIFRPASGMPTLATVAVSAGMVGDKVVLLSAEPAPLGSQRNPISVEEYLGGGRRVASLETEDSTGLPGWPTPLSNVLALGLADILSVVDGDIDIDEVHVTLEDIRRIARKALAFDRDRMRLRFDDQHGNRSFVQFLDGRWKAFRNDGREVGFRYCFGPGADDAAIERDLSAARTVYSIQSAAMAHVTGLQDVRVEMDWERHHWNGESFVHVPR